MFPDDDQLVAKLGLVSEGAASAFMKVYEIDDWELLCLDDTLITEEQDQYHLDLYRAISLFPIRDWTSFLCHAVQKLTSICLKVTSQPVKNRLVINFTGARNGSQCTLASFSVCLLTSPRAKDFGALYIVYRQLPLLFCLAILATKPELLEGRSETGSAARPFLNLEKLLRSHQPAELPVSAFICLLQKFLPAYSHLHRIRVLRMEATPLNAPLRQSFEGLRSFIHLTSCLDLLIKFCQSNYTSMLRFSPLRLADSYLNTLELPALDFRVEVQLSLSSKVENREFCALKFIECFLPKLFSYLAEKLLTETAGPVPSIRALQTCATHPHSEDQNCSENKTSSEAYESQTERGEGERQRSDDFWTKVASELQTTVKIIYNLHWLDFKKFDLKSSALQFGNPENPFELCSIIGELNVKVSLLSSKEMEVEFKSTTQKKFMSKYLVSSPGLLTAIQAAEAKFIEINFADFFGQFVGDLSKLNNSLMTILEKKMHSSEETRLYCQNTNQCASSYKEKLVSAVNAVGQMLMIDVAEEGDNVFKTRFSVDKKPYCDFRLKARNIEQAVEECCKNLYEEANSESIS